MKVNIDSQCGRARATSIRWRNHTVRTPMFMPVGTVGTVKGMLNRDLRDAGAQVILGNTYHLYLRPGLEVLQHFGGLHRLMDWHGPILTDSGGYQFFSLRENTKTTDEGVHFRSHIDGSRHLFTPERVIEIQNVIGSDIQMVLDECPALPATPQVLETAMRRTTAWAQRSLAVSRQSDAAVFAIVQGGTDISRRLSHMEELAAMEVSGRSFDGLALGGLAVGEAPQEMYEVLDAVAHQLPADRPRYLMGVGRPEDLLMAVASGVDMFDCVLPTRNARNGQLFTSTGRLNLRNAAHRMSDSPPDVACACMVCRSYSRGYLHHLFRAGEMLGPQLATIHNVSYYLGLMKGAREAIMGGRYREFHALQAVGWRGENS